MSSLLALSVVNNFSHSVVCIFTLLLVTFDEELQYSQIYHIFCVVQAFGVLFKKAFSILKL